MVVGVLRLGEHAYHYAGKARVCGLAQVGYAGFNLVVQQQHGDALQLPGIGGTEAGEPVVISGEDVPEYGSVGNAEHLESNGGVEYVSVNAVHLHVLHVGMGIVPAEEDVRHSSLPLDVSRTLEAHASRGSEATQHAHPLMIGIPVVAVGFVHQVGNAVPVLTDVHSVDE